MITDAARRRRLAGAFAEDTDAAQAAEYDAMRPGYPKEVVERILAAGPDGTGHRAERIVELGAGTGILTRALLDGGADVVAVEPSPSMAEVLRETAAPAGPGTGALEVVEARAEETALTSGSADVVVAAQAWHWFDPQAAAAEIARLLVPGGTAAVVSNHLDVSAGWVHRLARIMRAGDVHRPDWTPPLDPTAFEAVSTEHAGWTRALTPYGIRRLATTLSSWLAADDADRARRRANLDWYLDEHLGLGADEEVELPYLTVLHTARRR
ncbi:class I SAM-dependent methyltransferase [Nesterenkonia sp. F]|uniref:class I SAM-dependent methyltransferase n=1 Tax=Nesterenkonia sp. F TaxID=795955 RepID=UPI000255D0F8|nr:class I SAM-dependent methyltransferase [Nesterenkonia sp. F]